MLVFGGNHHNTLGVLRSLGRRGVRPDLLLVDPDNQGYVSKSRYIDRLYLCATYADALICLKENYQHKSDRTAVICTSDYAIGLVDENRDVLLDKFILPGTRQQGFVGKYMDKNVMAEVAAQAGLILPRTFNTVEGFLPEDVALPCIAKPMRSVDGSKSDICVCYTKEDVVGYNERTLRACELQVQEFVERDFEYQLIGCSINAGENVIIPGVSKIISAAEGSNTGFLRYEHLDGTYPLEECKSFIRKIGYSGLFSIEFIRDKSGVDYFMEINFRNDGNSICVTAAGVNLPYIWYLACCGEDYSEEIKEISPVYIMPEFDELLRVPKRKLAFSVWVKEMVKADAYMEFDFKDQLPFWNRIGFYVKLIVRKALSKIK